MRGGGDAGTESWCERGRKGVGERAYGAVLASAAGGVGTAAAAAGLVDASVEHFLYG